MLFFALGFISTLPSTYVYAILGILSVLTLTNILRAKFSPKHSLLGLVVTYALFCTATSVGLVYDQPEAWRYFLRALFASLIVFFYITSLKPIDEISYNSWLLGALAGIIVNSIAVVFFSLMPETYQAWRINEFSGYDKGARFLRSPGLQTGTDTAGYLAVIGVVLRFYLRQKGVASLLLSRVFFYVLLLTPIFCSRSAMLLSAIMLGPVLLVWRRLIPAADKAIFMFFILAFSGVALSLIALLLFPESVSFLSVATEIVPGVRVDAIYAVSDGGSYVDQYSFRHLFSVIPVGDPFLYDNEVGKLLASTGVVGFGAGMLVLIYIIVGLAMSAPRGEKAFVFFLIFIYIFANIKNSYLFYSFFVSMISVLFCRVQRCPKTLGSVTVRL